MLRKFFYVGLLGCLISPGCNEQTHSVKNAANNSLFKTDSIITPATQQPGNTNPDSTARSYEFKSLIKYDLKDTLEADLNGDEVKEKTYWQETNGQRHLYITDGATKQVIKIGQDSSFRDMGDNFSWVDSWALTNDSSTFEIEIIDGEIKGEKNVSLHYPSIVVRKEEAGGVITWNGKTYKWVHQSD